ncbi:acyl-CoA dehydrogenase family protein [Nocardia ninae]|uniref:Putative oxidoreductase n=1 Tax=Nocardia ninae NBRC 108245 TaxID=1210091 RepID=A0A511MHK8_9NOCA|nr:acyl-CoA dehydrogenase family protein [Nocardia ninae]GEM40154.1 putative oxidoreductase [Nocardia ninae NBRC 108245]
MILDEEALRTTEELVPGLLADVAAYSLIDLEENPSNGIDAFRKSKAPGLLVPEVHGGKGATALQALNFTVALGAVAPSLTVAATMHNFTLASMRAFEDKFHGMEWVIMDAIAHESLLVSSAGAEGRSGEGQLTPKTTAVRRGDDWVINGSKKPCSLSRSMDLLSASVQLIEDGHPPRLGMVLVPANVDGIEIRPFWNSPVLRGTESDEVLLKDVVVPDQLVMKVEEGDRISFDEVQRIGLTWFTLLVSATYLGMATTLVQRLFESGKGTAQARSEAATELRAALLGLERIAMTLDSPAKPQMLFDALVMRYAVQDSVQRCVRRSTEVLGGMEFINNPAIGYLNAATQAFAFHPPTRNSMWGALDEAFRGNSLEIV